MTNPYRWKADITYLHDHHVQVETVYFDELHELHDIVEAGPNFYCIDSIEVRTNGLHPRMTVEQAAAL